MTAGGGRRRWPAGGWQLRAALGRRVQGRVRVSWQPGPAGGAQRTGRTCGASPGACPTTLRTLSTWLLATQRLAAPPASRLRPAAKLHSSKRGCGGAQARCTMITAVQMVGEFEHASKGLRFGETRPGGLPPKPSIAFRLVSAAGRKRLAAALIETPAPAGLQRASALGQRSSPPAAPLRSQRS